MNNNPNNNRRPTGNRPPHPINPGTVRQPDQRRRQVKSRPPVQNRNTVSAPKTRRPAVPRGGGNTSRRNRGGLSGFFSVWAAVLALALVVILITVGLRGCGKDDTRPVDGTAIGTIDTTTEIVTEAETTTYPVDHADYTGNTAAFSGELSFTNGILIDIENNTVVASRGGDEKIYPASMTKVMTLIVAAEAVEDLDETFTMTAEITDPLFQANASVAGFLVGEQVTVRDLIYGLILPSGGDGALGLAYHIAGSEEAFAELMNKKAAELGLTKTHFTNWTGRHGDDHYRTCHEIALIVEYAIQNEFMREVLTTYQYTTESTPEHPEGILLTSTLLSRMSGDESETMFVQGGKTGFTTEAKNCLASFATKLVPGMDEAQLKLQPTKYILVTAGSGEKFGPVFDAISVYKDFADGADTADAAVTADIADTTRTPDDEPQDGTTASSQTENSDGTKKEPVKIYTASPPTR